MKIKESLLYNKPHYNKVMTSSDSEKGSSRSSSQGNLRIKMFPWQDWHEWVSVFHLLFSDLSVMAACASDEREIDLLKS
jgi:hypothetical protein